jgi:hypothetical protein
MEIIKQISELTKDDSFLVAVSIKKGDNIETQCLTNNFTYGDIPIATLDITRNIQKLAAQAAPITPMALQEAAVQAPDVSNIPEPEDVIVYAEGEEE